MYRAVQTHYVERSGMVRTALGFWLVSSGVFSCCASRWGSEFAAGRFLWLGAAAAWIFFFAGGSLAMARRRARKANEGTPQYVCVDEDEPVEKFRPPPRRGLRWLTW